MSNHLPLIAITSHRGGSWKSACAAGISLQLARSGISTLLLDPAKSGGLFACDSDEFRSQPGETLKRRRHVELPLTLAHAPDLLTMERPGAKALEVAEQLGAEMALIDLPTV
ncbi:hypothetical protein GC173_14910, partial [bacterium]|nr:hypothetical protein [bacterium]